MHQTIPLRVNVHLQYFVSSIVCYNPVLRWSCPALVRVLTIPTVCHGGETLHCHVETQHLSPFGVV